MIAALASIVLVAVNRCANSRRRAKRSAKATSAPYQRYRRAHCDNRASSTTRQAASMTCRTPYAISLAQADLRLCWCRVPAQMPVDPSTGSIPVPQQRRLQGSGEAYDTGYTVTQDDATHRITICSPGAVEPAIAESQPYCITR